MLYTHSQLTPWENSNEIWIRNFQTNFSDWWLGIFCEIASNECHRTMLMITQHWFRSWLGAIRQQAITWGNIDPVFWCHMASSLDPRDFKLNFRYVIFKLILVIDGWGYLWWNSLRWMWLDVTNNNSTLVQGMAWCCEATGLCLGQCWPCSMLQYGVIRSEWDNKSTDEFRNLSDK